MATTIVTSYFATAGVPATGILTATVKIWEVLAGSDTLVVNSAAMTEVGDGIYKYVFTTFDPDKDYVIVADKGTGVQKERFSIGAIGDVEVNLDAADLNAIGDAVAPRVWQEQASLHTDLDTMGLLQNTTAANTAALQVDVTTALAIVDKLLKYQENRTKIDTVAKTLTVYDNNGITPLHVFDLKDASGTASVAEVYERVPQ